MLVFGISENCDATKPAHKQFPQHQQTMITTVVEKTAGFRNNSL